MKKSFLCFALLCATHCFSQDVYILIHGTWGQQSAWYKKGGVFFDQLEIVVNAFGARVESFIWSGKNSHDAREKTARSLVQFIKNYCKHDTITLIGHSHGANVGFLATQLLASTNIKIARFFALGAPICQPYYEPDMNVVTYVYNFISFADIIQPVAGLFQREFLSHERIANIRVLINHKEPSHSQLCDPQIAKWISMIHADLMHLNFGNFDSFSFVQPGIIHFNHNKFPRYEIDGEREAQRKRDEQMLSLLQPSLRIKLRRAGTLRMHDRSSIFLQTHK